MRKVFTFIAAMLVAFAASAATIQVAAGSGTLKAAVEAAAAGDILVLADGDFVEGNQIVFDKNLIVEAAEGAHPVVAVRWYSTIVSGAQVSFRGICFDGATKHFEGGTAGAADHCFRSHDASNGTEQLTFIGCEFKGYPSYVLYAQRGDRRMDAITIRNCYFHDNVRSAIYVGYDAGHTTNLACNSVTIENSTFANFTNVGSALIYITNAGTAVADQVVRVDHCTFYNFVKNTEGDYTFIDVRKSTDVQISNCIFAQPEADMSKATYCYGGTISNCLSYNTTGHHSGPTTNNNIAGNPLFADVANADYTLEEGSPALGTATDGGNLGDSRWWPAIPSTATTIYFNPGVWNDANAKFAIYAYEPGKTPEYQWSDFLALAEGETNIYTGIVPAGYSHLILVRLDAACTTPNWDAKWNQTRNLTIVEGGKNLYTIDAWGDTGMPSPGTWSKYVAPIADGYYLIGDLNGVPGTWTIYDLSADRALHTNPMNPAEYMIEGVTLALGDQLKIVHVNNRAIDAWCPDLVPNYVVDAFHTGATDIYFCPTPKDDATWYHGQIYVGFTEYRRAVTNWATMCLPYNAEIQNATAYDVTSCLVDHIVVEPIVGNMVAGKPYIIKPTDPSADVVVIASGAKASVPDNSGVLKGNLDAETVVAANDNNYVLSNGLLHFVEAGIGEEAVTVKQYRAYLHIEATGAPALRIVEAGNEATNIQNVEGNEAAVKFIENGKLFIMKNGVVYDATGAVVK